MTKETGGMAFPIQQSELSGSISAENGMPMRDYFAAKALQGLISAMQSKEEGRGGIKTCAELSYDFADAMLEARKS